MRLIDADALYERLKADEELSRDRVIDTPNSFPNGAVNPCAIRYMAQFCERTRLKKMVYDAPTIDPVKHGKWEFEPGAMYCSNCGWLFSYEAGLEDEWNYCPFCGAKMEADDGKI